MRDQFPVYEELARVQQELTQARVVRSHTPGPSSPMPTLRTPRPHTSASGSIETATEGRLTAKVASLESRLDNSQRMARVTEKTSAEIRQKAVRNDSEMRILRLQLTESQTARAGLQKEFDDSSISGKASFHRCLDLERDMSKLKASNNEHSVEISRLNVLLEPGDTMSVVNDKLLACQEELDFCQADISRNDLRHAVIVRQLRELNNVLQKELKTSQNEVLSQKNMIYTLDKDLKSKTAEFEDFKIGPHATLKEEKEKEVRTVIELKDRLQRMSMNQRGGDDKPVDATGGMAEGRKGSMSLGKLSVVVETQKAQLEEKQKTIERLQHELEHKSLNIDELQASLLAQETQQVMTQKEMDQNFRHFGALRESNRTHNNKLAALLQDMEEERLRMERLEKSQSKGMGNAEENAILHDKTVMMMQGHVTDEIRKNTEFDEFNTQLQDENANKDDYIEQLHEELRMSQELLRKERGKIPRWVRVGVGYGSVVERNPITMSLGAMLRSERDTPTSSTGFLPQMSSMGGISMGPDPTDDDGTIY